ncbi:hypothetical protein ACFPOI_09405 [Nonomuraea angiospora]|uniref:Uncharacterized protein n=1 Tax=Nonomuraea angiospora TaxID=46172 RepID=A0ABR9M9J9_9ACTN|nr:hypothetical protein [Nonomuraea angiospora]MBE1589583.1 hypothetical protein [Nonomuraea angiospora]
MTPGYCEITSSDAGLGFSALASVAFGGNTLIWLAIIESTLMIFAFPALLVALTGKWPGRRFTQAVIGFLIIGGMVNVLVNALGRVLGNEGFLIVVFERLPRGGWYLPSIWFGFALIAAAYALRRAVGQQGKEAEARRMRP